MRVLALVLVMVILVGCEQDAVVSRTPVKQWTTLELTSCTYAGFCTQCGITFQGTFECSFGLKLMCLGKRPATTVFEQELLTYASGKSRTITHRTVQAVHGRCPSALPETPR